MAYMYKCPACGADWATCKHSGYFSVECSAKCGFPPVSGDTMEEASVNWNIACGEYLAKPENHTPRILDSGDRTEFATGAVRDMREGKGRMDLMPLGVVEEILDDDFIIMGIRHFMEDGVTPYLKHALSVFADKAYEGCLYTMLLEVGKHFEEGAKKYGENNWQKGIEPKYYVDSAIRHYLKWRRGDKDEPHDRAFVWNIMCCIWEVDWHVKSDVQKVEENIDRAELHPKCASCAHNVLNEHSVCKKCDDFSEWTDKIEVDISKEIHGSHKINKCCRCIYSGRPRYDYPCNECLYGSTHHFKPKEETK